MLQNIGLVFLGSGLGGALRYLVGLFMARLLPTTGFPFATVSINVIGCFLIGLLLGGSMNGASTSLRVLFIVGFCGGFTTFSAFSVDAVDLLRGGQYFIFLLYIWASVALSLIAVSLGYLLAK